MLAIQLKKYLSTVRDEANILVFVEKDGETRQLLFGDLDVNKDGNIVIDAEYAVHVKHTTIGA